MVFALFAVSCASEAAVTTTTTTAATTTPTTSTTTTTVPETTTTTVSEDQRIAEVTEIVRQVDFGWFDAIYRKDEVALVDWVARQENLDVGIDLMDDETFFTAQPTLEKTVVVLSEILIDRDDCIAASYFGDATAFRGPEAEGNTTIALWPRPSDGQWRSAYRGDLWQEACDVFTREDQLK